MADAFNQLLSFDTSSVIHISYMFNVRFRACVPSLNTLPSWAARTPRALPSLPSVPHLRDTRISLCIGCPLRTRQGAIAFNQPLSFETSSVIDISHMFYVRFRLRLLPTPELWATCTPRALLIRPSICVVSSVPRVHLSRVPPLGSAVCGCFQPAAEL